jgi:hypothetical protein
MQYTLPPAMRGTHTRTGLCNASPYGCTRLRNGYYLLRCRKSGLQGMYNAQGAYQHGGLRLQPWAVLQAMQAAS